MKSYFLTRGKEFIEVELLKNKPKYREIKYKEGNKKGKTVHIHPDGVAWGNMYPRFFQAKSKPVDYFNFKGRILMSLAKNKKTESYIPEFDDHFDFQKQTRDVIDAINAGENVILTGGGGSGKTSTFEQLAARINQPVIRVNLSVETRISDFIGKMHVKDGKTYWVDGILPFCMKNDIWLILDEVDAGDPSILMLLHPLLEEGANGGKLVIKENDGAVVTKSPGFRLLMTANSIGAMADRVASYAGTNQMNSAFLDRPTVIHWHPLSFKSELKVLKAKVGGLKHRWAVKMCEFAQDVREKKLTNENGGYDFPADTFSTRQILKWGKKTALHRSAIEGAKLAWLDKIAASEHEAIFNILELYFGKSNRRAKTGVEINERKSRKK